MIELDSTALLIAAPVVAVLMTLLAVWARVARLKRAGRWSAELQQAARRVGRLTPLALGLAAFAAGVALAGPRWGRRTVRSESKALDLVLMVDISRSMLAEDVAPSRLGRARREARRLVHDLPGDRIGLIAFAGQSFILTPLTVDNSAVQLLIDALDPDMASAEGTELGGALRQGRDLLQGGSEVADRVLVVFTDGETHDTLSDVLSAAARLRRDGIRLILVGEGGITPTQIPVRTPEGTFREYQRDENGQAITTWRRDDVLTQVADEAHGALVPASLNDQAGAVRELVRAYKRSPQATTTVADRPLQAWVPALVAVALLLAQTFTRRTAALAGLALVLAMGGRAREARAQWGRNPGDVAWRSSAFRAAAERYLAQVRRGDGGDTAWFNLGTAALAVGDTAMAGRALERAAASLDPEVRFRALYNAGLLSLRLAAQDSVNRERYLAEARERYREALLLRPDDRAAKWNLELAIHRSRGGGGGEAPKPGGTGGGASQPPPPVRESGLTQAQAEQVLNSISDEERQVRQGLARRRAQRGGGGERGVKNW